MPQVRQPAALQKVALDAIFEHVDFCCDQISVEGSLDEMNQVISAIKKVVISRMPWFLVADFSARFLTQFYCDFRPAMHLEAALEIVMDIEIVGLRCRGPILDYLDPQRGCRLRRLAELDLHYISHSLPMNLHNFYLNDLTSFKFAKRCTDLDLSVISRNCPKLQVVRVPNSPRVTDEGLSALSQCSDLRDIDVHRCSVTYSGMNRMLSVHKKLEKITGISYDDLFNFDLSVCPSISHFTSAYDRVSATHLRKIVTKFPNIAYLYLHGSVTENLSNLKSLNKLTELDIDFSLDGIHDDVDMMWTSIKELLTSVGANLTTLQLGFSWDYVIHDVGHKLGQREVDFIFDSCPNLECLKFDHEGGHIVIPSFRKLEVLMPRVPYPAEDDVDDDYSEDDSFEMLDDPTIEFDKLPNLRTLSLYNYTVDFQTIESIMLDNDKFPKLSVIEDLRIKDEDWAKLRWIAVMNNLELKIQKCRYFTR